MISLHKYQYQWRIVNTTKFMMLTHCPLRGVYQYQWCFVYTTKPNLLSLQGETYVIGGVSRVGCVINGTTPSSLKILSICIVFAYFFRYSKCHKHPKQCL